jgi:predicted short-subunit dehydrogenase-like oxidoreductase (DUF2520 family)
MNITILGAGNVATQLALVLKKSGHTIVQVYNRSNDAGYELAKTVGATFVSDFAQLTDADIYLVAVKDDAIAEVGNAFKTSGKIVAHTSGTKSKDLLQNTSANFGIFYPLQTMTKTAKVDFKNVPILIEGSNKQTVAKLDELAKTISKNVHIVDEQQRQWIHVAAVFANNFTNHLFGISEQLLLAQGLPFEILKPLIFNFIQNLEEHSPSEIQTGPAVRGDFKTIEKHMQLLGDDQRLQKIYEILTQSIIEKANKHIPPSNSF